MIILLFLALVYGPQLWVGWVLKRYNRKLEANFPAPAANWRDI
ncbi:MAG: hypothetical protein WBO16_04510 [Gammaproteobacteria bacterium]